MALAPINSDCPCDRSFVIDIDLHRYKCLACGLKGYYSDKAKKFYEEFEVCDVTGLTEEDLKRYKKEILKQGL